MKYAVLLAAVLLSGCADMFVHAYEPTLNKPYADSVKYKKDLAECHEWAKLTAKESARVSQGWTTFPLVAAAGYVEGWVADTEDRDHDRKRSGSIIQHINLCMERRGYAVNEMASKIPGGTYP